MSASEAMDAYYAHRLANEWWTPCADEAAQWVADWIEQRHREPSPFFDDLDGVGDLAIWRNDPERPDYPQPVLYKRFVSDDALWDIILKAAI